MTSTPSVEPLLFSLSAPPPPASLESAPAAASEMASEAEPLVVLSGMFPDVDKEIIEAVLQATPSVEAAVQQLLDMSCAEGATCEDAALSAEDAAAIADAQRLDHLSAEDAAAIANAQSLDADEELAWSLFRQFADSLEGVPDEVRQDPERYDRYVREQLERQLETPEERTPISTNEEQAPPSQQASEVLAKIKQSSANFFERIGLGKQSRPATGGWRSRDPNNYCAPLISSMDVADSTTSTRGGASRAYAPPQAVASPLMLSRPPEESSS